MKLYKHKTGIYSLINHENFLFEIIPGKNKYLTKMIGKVSGDYVTGGTLIRGHIPNKLKSICFTLNKKPQKRQSAIQLVRSSKSSSKSGLKDKDITPYSEWAKKLRDL